jgi:hypothetical protein
MIAGKAARRMPIVVEMVQSEAANRQRWWAARKSLAFQYLAAYWADQHPADRQEV